MVANAQPDFEMLACYALNPLPDLSDPVLRFMSNMNDQLLVVYLSTLLQVVIGTDWH